jgi:hypothetical protein
MNSMSRPAKVIVGLLTLWPLWFFGLVGVVVVDPTANYGFVIAAQLCLFVAALALTVCFVVHAYRSPRVPADKRVLWVVLLLLTGLFTLPVYFWLYIRPA